MARSHLTRPKFDPAADFFVTKSDGLRFNGKAIGPGQPFDKHTVPERRLRQLYEHRWLGLVPQEGLNKPDPESDQVAHAAWKLKGGQSLNKPEPVEEPVVEEVEEELRPRPQVERLRLD